MPRLTKAERYMREFWWGKPKTEPREVGEALISTAKQIRIVNNRRINKMREHTGMYRNRDCSGFMPGDVSQDHNLDEPFTYNVTKSCTDTTLAKLTLHKPVPNFSTFGATEDLQERARGMEKLCVGVIQNCEGHKTARAAMKDACLCPVGVVKVYDEGDEIKLKRMHPSKVLWDLEATVDGRRPTSFYEFDERSRADLMAQFPEYADEIEVAPHVNTKKTASSENIQVRDLVRVIEGWKEPTMLTPGRHTIAIQGATLFDEEWKDPAPYVFVRWADDEIGFDGLSIAHELYEIQNEIAFVLDKIRENNEVLAESYYLTPEGATDDEAFLNNTRLRKVPWRGGAARPEIVHPPIAHPQVFSYLEQLWARAFELVGLSQLSATSKKPADLRSGAALRTYLDVETVRFAVAQDNWEQLFVGLAKAIVCCARRLAKRKPNWSVNYFGADKVLQKVNWKDVELKDDQFQVRVYPISALPLQPAARLERAAELFQSQAITQEQFLVLADMPDTEKWARLATAPFEDLEKTFEYMLKTGSNYIKPLEFQNMEIGVPLCQSYWSRAACDEAPQEALDRLEQWMVDAQELQQRKMEQQLALQQMQQQMQQMQMQQQQMQQPQPMPAAAGPGPGGPAPEPPPGGAMPPGEQLAA
jgi:hypothetical protein